MKLHLMDYWHHADSQQHDPQSPSRHQNLLYVAILVLGCPAVVAATMFVVHYLYEGVLWLLPT